MESNIKKGKIIKILGGFYYIHHGDTIIECRARGNFRKEKIKPLVGDYADFRVPKDKEHLGYIEKIYDRKNSLIRPPVSNIDQSIVVFAVKDPNPNYIILDKFLINSSICFIEIGVIIRHICFGIVFLTVVCQRFKSITIYWYLR